MKVKFNYKNHRGEVEEREVDVTSIDYFPLPHNKYGYGPGWFISGYDYSRGREGKEFRSFALTNVQIPDDLFLNLTGQRPFQIREIKK